MIERRNPNLSNRNPNPKTRRRRRSTCRHWRSAICKGWTRWLRRRRRIPSICPRTAPDRCAERPGRPDTHSRISYPSYRSVSDSLLPRFCERGREFLSGTPSFFFYLVSQVAKPRSGSNGSVWNGWLDPISGRSSLSTSMCQTCS